VTKAASGSQLVLFTLAAGQFLMTLDSSVMNVSIEEVAKDVGTTVTGIQTAITMYTLVMAALMITGAKIGAMIGRRRAFAIGCVIYGCGSFTTSIAPNYAVLLFGWSFLEGVGACLILPAIVALVAGNFVAAKRPAAYGLVAAAGAIAGRRRPADRRLLHDVFLVALGVRGRGRDRGDHPLFTGGSRTRPSRSDPHLDVVGAVLSAAG
jgi:MFS family permease